MGDRSLLAVAHGGEGSIGPFPSRISLSTSTAATGAKRRAQVWKSVSRTLVRRRDHSYDAFLVINLVEESPRPDLVSPCLWRVTPQLANVQPEAKPLTQVPSDGSPQHTGDVLATSPCDRL